MKSIAGYDSRTGEYYEFECTADDGRRVYRVPERKWTISGWPTLEVGCRVCGQAIRFGKYSDIDCTVERTIPEVHSGACEARKAYARVIPTVRQLAKKISQAVNSRVRVEKSFKLSLQKLMDNAYNETKDKEDRR
jgi:hypothetical protein